MTYICNVISRPSDILITPLAGTDRVRAVQKKKIARFNIKEKFKIILPLVYNYIVGWKIIHVKVVDSSK